MLLKLCQLSWNDAAVGIFFSPSVPIILMIFLRREKPLKLKKGCDDLKALGGEFCDLLVGQLFLALIYKEDCRAILSTNIFSLAVFLSGVVDREKDV